jgi:nucleoside-diphosphate-sugar epimerase
LTTTKELAAGRIYNVGDSKALTMAEWIRAIGRAAGWKGEILFLPKDRLPAHLRAQINTAQHLVADTTRIRKELGYKELVSIDEALRRTVQWEREHPPDKIDPGMFDYITEDKILTELKREKRDSRMQGE